MLIDRLSDSSTAGPEPAFPLRASAPAGAQREKIIDKKLQELSAAIDIAQKAQREYLRAVYPVGARVEVMLRHGQKNPSTGTVISHWPTIHGGKIGIEIDNAKEWSRNRVRDIGTSSIVRLIRP